MHRRALLSFAALVALARPAAARPPAVGELRLGMDPARAGRVGARLGVPVRTVRDALVEALDAGHLELALLTPAELARARTRMGARLLVLDGAVGSHIPVTRRVLPPALRSAMDAALDRTRA